MGRLAASADEAGAPSNEIDVTPEMIEAGLIPLFRFHREASHSESVVAEIYRALRRASPLGIRGSL
jgi:hypothetical protein